MLVVPVCVVTHWELRGAFLQAVMRDEFTLESEEIDQDDHEPIFREKTGPMDASNNWVRDLVNLWGGHKIMKQSAVIRELPIPLSNSKQVVYIHFPFEMPIRDYRTMGDRLRDACAFICVVQDTQNNRLHCVGVSGKNPKHALPTRLPLLQNLVAEAFHHENGDRLRDLFYDATLDSERPLLSCEVERIRRERDEEDREWELQQQQGLKRMKTGTD